MLRAPRQRGAPAPRQGPPTAALLALAWGALLAAWYVGGMGEFLRRADPLGRALWGLKIALELVASFYLISNVLKAAAYLRLRAPGRRAGAPPAVSERLPAVGIIYLCCEDLDLEALESLCAVRYAGPLFLIVHDDSRTAEGRQRVERAVRDLEERQGRPLTLLRRPVKAGGKPGAVNFVLQRAGWMFPYFVLCDNDSIALQPDFLPRALAHFGDPKVAAVQFRNRGVVAEGAGALQRHLARAIDAFDVYMRSYARFGLTPFLGHNAILRTRHVLEAGGLSEGVFADDIDLTLRLAQEGLRVVYAPGIEFGERHPSSYTSFLIRSRKWAYGCMQVLSRHVRGVLGSRALAPREKFWFLEFAGFYAVQALLTPYLLLSYVAIPLLSQPSGIPVARTAAFGALVLLAILAPTLALCIADRRLREWPAVGWSCALVYGGSVFAGTRGVLDHLRAVVREWVPTNQPHPGRGLARTAAAQAALGAALFATPLWAAPDLLLAPSSYLFISIFLFSPLVALAYRPSDAAAGRRPLPLPAPASGLRPLPLPPPAPGLSPGGGAPPAGAPPEGAPVPGATRASAAAHEGASAAAAARVSPARQGAARAISTGAARPVPGGARASFSRIRGIALAGAGLAALLLAGPDFPPYPGGSPVPPTGGTGRPAAAPGPGDAGATRAGGGSAGGTGARGTREGGAEARATPEGGTEARGGTRVGGGVEIRGDQIFVGGRPFRVRGIHYSPWLPGTGPMKNYAWPDRAVLEQDLRHLRDLRVNTLLVHDAPDAVFDLAESAGLKLIHAFYVNWHSIHDDALFAARREEVAARVRALRERPSVLLWLLGNEIPEWVVRERGRQVVAGRLRSLYDAVKAADPAHPVSHANWPVTLDLDLSFMDVAAFNLYPLWPREVVVRGYGAYIDEVLKPAAGGRPLLITEFGVNTIESGEERQAQILRVCWKEIERRTAGGVVFEFVDEWWKNYDNPIREGKWWEREHAPDDEKTHDLDPEEHYGVMTADRSPRPAYAVVREMFDEPAPALAGARAYLVLPLIVLLAYTIYVFWRKM